MGLLIRENVAHGHVLAYSLSGTGQGEGGEVSRETLARSPLMFHVKPPLVRCKGLDVNSEAILRSALERAGFSENSRNIELMGRHLDAVLEANQRINLTAIRNVDSAVLLHVVDSLMCTSELADAPEGPLADLGSGAGFPGVPLAIVSGREAVLVESVGKKASFLREVVGRLGLEGRVRVESARAEELARSDRGRFAAVTARAVSSLPALVELASPLLMQGGRLIALKGRMDPEEVESGRAVGELVGMSAGEPRQYRLLGREDARSCVTFTKIGSETIDLPRRNGMAQRRPLR